MYYASLIKNRRSIRDFTEKKVDPKIIDEILHETCMAPSASNTQPWRFIVIHDQRIMKEISDESKKNLLRAIEKDSNLPVKQYESYLRERSNVFYNAPCLILIVGQNTYNHFYHDCSLAAAYLMFAAAARNLGTCWIGLGEKIEDLALRKKIGLPDDHEVVAPIIVGYPTATPKTGPRNEPKILRIV